MPASSSVHKAVHCPRCRQAMEALAVEGHYGQPVHIDLCASCDLLWLDELEAVNLSGLGWVRLLRRMQVAQQTSATQNAAHDGSPPACLPSCPRCGHALKQVSNMSVMGRFGELECPRCRGGLAGFAQLLARRGLVRAMTRRDLDVLQREGREPACLNCGGSLSREHGARGLLDREAQCSWCRSPLLVIDMPRFFAALLTRHADPVAARHLAWACRGCGAAVEPSHAASCETCGDLVVVPSMLDLRPLLDAAEPLLRGQLPRAAKAHGQRLRERSGDHTQTALYRYWLRFKDMLNGE